MAEAQNREAPGFSRGSSHKASASPPGRGSADWAALVVTGPDALAALSKLVSAHWARGESVAIDGRILFRPGTAAGIAGVSPVVELVPRTFAARLESSP